MTERDYAIRSFKEITLNAARHTEERMDLYYEKIKALMNNYQDLILENQMVLDELEPVSYTHLTLPTTPYV